MSFFNRHFLDFSLVTEDDILFLFEQADRFTVPKSSLPTSPFTKSVGLLFLENSTRTTLSFELACRDCGYIPLKFDDENSSLNKGESILDTLLTLQALGVHAIVIRHGQSFSLKEISKNLKIPIINAGEGVSGHPTQALLDAYTILKFRGKIKKEKVLIIGDSKFSRVAKSNLELLTLLGAEVAFCGPKDFLIQNAKTFDSLDEGIKWATVLMALRPQLERHGESDFLKIKADFIKNYCLTKSRIKDWNKKGIILHPGPFIRDQEITSEVISDPRSKIFDQVKNGRKVRRALLALTLGES